MVNHYSTIWASLAMNHAHMCAAVFMCFHNNIILSMAAIAIEIPANRYFGCIDFVRLGLAWLGLIDAFMFFIDNKHTFIYNFFCEYKFLTEYLNCHNEIAISKHFNLHSTACSTTTSVYGIFPEVSFKKQSTPYTIFFYFWCKVADLFRQMSMPWIDMTVNITKW